MIVDVWTDRLSEYIDGELTREEQAALEAHLLACSECGRVLQELRAVVTRARLVVDRPPERDLWAGIAAQVNSPARRESASEPPARVVIQQKRRISFSIPQLAAASIVLMLLSAGAVYVMLSNQPAAQLAQTPAQSSPSPV